MKTLNLTGRKFGHLTAIKDVGVEANKGGSHIWLCKCNCGKMTKVRAGHLMQNQITGCGCRRRLPEGEAALNCLIDRYKRNAKNRNIEFILSKDDFREITKQECAYCGTSPDCVVRKDYNGFNGDYIYNGIDRIDSKLGYTVENCVPCCARCNWMKNNIPKDDFIAHITKIYRYSVICDY